MTMIAPMSSITASASRRTRRAGGTRRPSTVRTPTANAMSVAIGIPQPAAPAWPWLRPAYIAAGISMPPSAAASGSAARRSSDSSPPWISRRISRPTTKKKTVIRTSLIQKWSGRTKPQSPNRSPIGVSSTSW